MAIPRTEVDLVLGSIDADIDAAVESQITGGVVTPDKFVPKDEIQLDFQLRRRADKLERINMLKRARDARIQIITNEFQRRIDELVVEIEGIEELVGEGLTELREEAVKAGGKLNSLSSPSGRVYFKVATEVEYPDDEESEDFKKLVALGRKAGVDPRVKVSLNKVELKKHMTFADDGKGGVVVAIDGKPTKLISASRTEKIVISSL